MTGPAVVPLAVARQEDPGASALRGAGVRCSWHSRAERGGGHCHPGDRPLPRAPRSPCCAGNSSWPGGRAAAPGNSPPPCAAPRKKRKGSPGSPTAGARACVDPDRIRQAIDNLLGNAPRFAPAGSVIVTAAREDGPDLAIEVRDAGPGFPADFLPHAFERFRRPDTGRSRDSGGGRPRTGHRRGDRRRPRRNSGRTQQTGRRCRGQPVAARRLPLTQPKLQEDRMPCPEPAVRRQRVADPGPVTPSSQPGVSVSCLQAVRTYVRGSPGD